MSRSRHEPNRTRRDRVRTLAGLAISHTDIGAIIGCSEKTLRLYYRTELDEGAEQANAAIVEALLRLVQSGNVASMIFFEKCRGGKRETIKEEISGPGGGPIRPRGEITIVPVCDVSTCDANLESSLLHDLGYPETDEQCRLAIAKIEAEIAKVHADAKK